MLATKVDQSDGAIADQSALTDWLQGHLLPGRIACLGRPFPLDEATEGYEVIELTDLSAGATGGITFDHAWVNNFADTGRDPIAAVWRLFHIVTPGGLAVLTVPLGISVERVSSHPYYVGTLYRLIDPLFEVVETYVGQDGVAVVGRRRDVPSGAPSSQLNAARMPRRSSAEG